MDEGFQLLRNPNSLVFLDGTTDTTATRGRLPQGGYAQDMIDSHRRLNPLGILGLQYCHCVAVVNHGCDPADSVYGTFGTSEISSDDLATFVPAVGLEVDVLNKSDMTEEYHALSVQFAQAIDRDSEFTQVNDEDEKATIMAIAKGLTSKLDNCIATAISIDTTNPGATPQPPALPACSVSPSITGCSDPIGTVIITYDRYPREITWTLTGPGGVSASGIGSNCDQSSVSEASFCLVPGDYEFEITDSYGDGLCCTGCRQRWQC